MDKQLVPMLQYAAGVGVPLTFEVSDPNGHTTTHQVSGPFAIAGRGDECDLPLKHPRIAYRQLYFQAIGNRVAAIDLFSATSNQWHGPEFRGWVSPNHTVEICGYKVKLADSGWVSSGDVAPPDEFRPREEQSPTYGSLPEVELELLNTSAQGMKWPINRVITLVGRDERCRITVADERVSRVHCLLLLLPTGLWVIDLLGKGGIQVGGKTCQCSLLSDGAELQIGRYKLAASYPQISAMAAEAARAMQASTGTEFVTQQNKILRVETYLDSLIVLPMGDSQNYFYQDIYVESSRVMDLVTSRKYRNVVIDFSNSVDLGHLVIEALAALCRNATGRSVLCSIPPQMMPKLERTSLLRIWPYFPNRGSALQNVYSDR